MWTKLPREINHELELLNKHTKKTGREASITFCLKNINDKKRLFVGNNKYGNNDSTEIGDCKAEFNAHHRIGDAHSHPTTSDTIGNTPSEADLYLNLQNSFLNESPQVSCIVSPISDVVKCFTPKNTPTRKMLKKYEDAMISSRGHTVHPYILDNVGKDFEFGIFDRKSGQLLKNPDPKRMVKNSFGKSTRGLRQSVKEMEYGIFCQYIQDTNNPEDKEDNILHECKEELSKRGILDYLGIVDSLI